MKNSVLLTFMILFASAGILSAQPNPPDYYTGRTRISGDGYTYNIKLSKYSLNISNALNEIVHTSPPQTELWFQRFTDMIKGDVAVNFFKSIAPDEIKAILNEYKYEKSKPSGRDSFINSMTVILAVNPITGEIMELYFSFSNTPALRGINPDKLYQLEQYIKQNIKVTGDSFDFSFFINPVKTAEDIEKIENEMRKHKWIRSKIDLSLQKI